MAHAVGPSCVTAYGLPGTDSQRALNLLKEDFKTQSGDVDTVVFHVSRETIDLAAVRGALTPMLAWGSALPHVAGVVSPYSPRGPNQVSAHRMTAFATVNYDRRASRLAIATGKPLLAEVDAMHVPGLQVAAGGPVARTPRDSDSVRPRRSGCWPR